MTPSTNTATFIFWDVQHGHAAYIATPGGQHIAIDLGVGSYKGSDATFSPLLHLKNNGVQSLDAVVVTHPHRDHIDDIFNFYALSPRVFYRPRHLSEDDIRKGNQASAKPVIDKYLEIDRDYNRALTPGEIPFDFNNNGGMQFEYFVPKACGTSNLNNHSVVTVAAYAGSKMLIPGDNEPASWDELLAQPSFLQAIRGTDILLAPHHGRDSGFSAALFKHIQPRLTIISDGPFCDTSATARYGQQTRGWTVHKRSGGSEERSCVTTRNDGVIVVKFGITQSQPFIEVTID